MNDQSVMHNSVVNDNGVGYGNGVGNNEEEERVFHVEVGNENGETDDANGVQPLEAEK